MARQSKYSDTQVRALLQDLAAVLEQHHASVDLALMALGDTVTNLLKSSVAPAQQQALVETFCRALQQSFKTHH
ncbi:DUF1414 domain-containing protein [Pasteurellaceae bacterium HPA106]|uniref:DUF1414 domain-containing protein n=1 Tax=Spirabiliibacterium pneumoniae TaxID=221400 RepID=UPI001AAE1825|nr:DUF1414 domain-containing protein [Spirabiliibacterium pneumoniae]MBE2895389.1 DUF1414 domain-containing protein [Spirabiliibacterium pneumoniae]